jgi:hypothetical protein
MSSGITEEAFAILLREVQKPDAVTGKTPTAPEIAKIMGCSVRRVENHPAFYDSLHWRRQMEAIRRRRR